MTNQLITLQGSHSYYAASALLTIVVHHPRLLLAAVHWQTNDLHLNKGVDDLREEKTATSAFNTLAGLW